MAIQEPAAKTNIHYHLTLITIITEINKQNQLSTKNKMKVQYLHFLALLKNNLSLIVQNLNH